MIETNYISGVLLYQYRVRVSFNKYIIRYIVLYNNSYFTYINVLVYQKIRYNNELKQCYITLNKTLLVYKY